MAWFPNCGEDDEFPDPEIGVFGDAESSSPPKRDLKREVEARRLARKREADRATSAAFNSYMIHLFNQSLK